MTTATLASRSTRWSGSAATIRSMSADAVMSTTIIVAVCPSSSTSLAVVARPSASTSQPMTTAPSTAS